MTEPGMRWGPLARGLYTAMLSLSVLVAWHVPAYLGHYVALLIFLGLGLRPLLEKTGLDDAFGSLLVKIEDRRWKKFEANRRREIERRERDKRYRHRHVQDKRLPRRW